MYFNVAAFITLAAVATLNQHIEPPVRKKVEVTLYYESLCPYSRSFILHQLVPTWEAMSRFMEVHLVPYGLTRRSLVNGHWYFACQHGQEECNMDIVSACAVDMLEAIDTNRLLAFVFCLEESIYYSTALNRTIKCAKSVNILLNELVYCVASSEKMMVRFAEMTENVQPLIRALPAIQINGVYVPNSQKYIRHNLTGTICQFSENCFGVSWQKQTTSSTKRTSSTSQILTSLSYSSSKIVHPTFSPTNLSSPTLPINISLSNLLISLLFIVLIERCHGI